MHFAVDPWLPEYGPSLEAAPPDEGEPEARIEAAVELPPAEWQPLDPAARSGRARSLLFIDGVRRIDARVWINGDDGVTRMGLCASYAAGLVRCSERAQVERIEVERALIAPGEVDSIPIAGGWSYASRAVASDELGALVNELQQRLGALEVRCAEEVAAAAPAELTVVDGPLSGRENVPHGVGYVKTHRRSYLPPDLSAVVARLQPGQRTPLFVTQTSWSRYSWYLRLPGGSGHPWAGVVRCELSAGLSAEEARRRADLASATLPLYASAPHKDPRAPQNLYPIAGLERTLRRRLGDRELLYRRLVEAAGRGVVSRES